MLSTPARRSLAGFALGASLLPALLVLLACLPVPIGDPEASRVDPALTGVWIAADAESTGLFIFRPYDRRTWLLTTLEVEHAQPTADAASSSTTQQTPAASLQRMLDDTSETGVIQLFKVWVSTFGGRRFLCLEPLTVFDKGRLLQPAMWLVFRVDMPGASALHVTSIAYESPWKDVKTRREAETVLRRHANRQGFYSETMIFARVPPADYGTVEEIAERFALDTHFQ